MPLSDVLNTTTTLKTRAITAEGFGLALILGTVTSAVETAMGANLTAELDRDTWQTTMTANGFVSTDQHWIDVSDFFSQARTSSRLLVGRRATAVAQVQHVDIDGTTDGTFTITLDGTDYTFVASSDTATEIRDGLISALGAATHVTAALVDTDTLSITANEAGVPLTVTVDHSVTPTDISTSVDTANVGIGEDVAAIRLERDDWYFLLETSRSSGVIKTAAAVVEALTKYFWGQSNEAGIIGSGSTDVASQLKALNYARTALMYHPTDAEGAAAAWLGLITSYDAGAVNWSWKTLASVAATDFTSNPSATTNLQAKNCNYFERLSSQVSATFFGQSVDGTFADLIRGRDALDSTILADYQTLLLSEPKVAMTDQGGEQISAIVEGAIEKFAGVDDSPALIVEGSASVKVQKIADMSASDKANRIAPRVTWSAQAQGAINKVLNVSGTIEL